MARDHAYRAAQFKIKEAARTGATDLSLGREHLGPDIDRLTELPELLRELSHLQSLNLEYNRLTVLPDPVSGWNLHVKVEGFTFTPEYVGAEPRMSEGHAHLYVDGVKVARVYGTDFHLGDLGPGTHRITLALAANDHRSFTHDGEEIEATVIVEAVDAAPQAAAAVHHHGHQ